MNLFITDATEISIEMILVTDFALDISDGRHPNVYVYRTGAGNAERDGGMRKSDGKGEHMRCRKIIREVRLGRIRKLG